MTESRVSSAWTRLLPAGLLLCSLFLGGCANELSIFRDSYPWASEPRVVTEDAKQRNVYMVPESGVAGGQKVNGNTGNLATNWRICAEAAPDVFSAYSASAAGDLGVSGINSDPQARLRIALALAESAGTIERTQTINLLRESMYRTCERYLSGAISPEELVVQAARDQHAMIGILAIEQLTRTVRPPSTILVAGGTNASLEDSKETAAALSDALKAQSDSAAKKKTADDAYKSDNCDEVLKAATRPTDTTAAAAWDQCTKDKKAAAEAKSDFDQKTEVVTRLSNALPGNVQASTTPAGTNVSGGVGTTVANASDLAAVAQAVTTIVQNSFAFDEIQMMCITLIRSGQPIQDQELKGDCDQLVKEAAHLDVQKMQAESAALVLAVPPNVQARRELIADYVKRLSPPDWDRLAASLGTPRGEGALSGILGKIAHATSIGQLDAIAQKIRRLFGTGDL